MTERAGARTVRLVGERAALVECPDLAEVLGLHAALTADPLPGQVEVLAAARTVLVRASDRRARDRLLPLLRSVPAAPAGRHGGAVLTLDTVYDGADLAAVAELTGMSPEAVVTAHTDQPWTAAFGGFAPGFAYLVGATDVLDVPRHLSPRTAVPAGAVGLAGRFSAVYPRASPGGWQLIGRTDAPMWDLDREPPALVRPGDQVRFRAVRQLVVGRPRPVPASTRSVAAPTAGQGASSDPGTVLTSASDERTSMRRSTSPDGGTGPASGGDERTSVRETASSDGGTVAAPASNEPTSAQHPRRTGRASVTTRAGATSGALRVVSPGALSLLEDLGRPGLLELGVSPSGAADRGAARQANRLVGNDRSAAVIETVLGGLELEAVGDQVLAVSGAPVPLALLRDDVERAQPPLDAPFALPDGHRVRLGQPASGLRAYVAVRGGVAVPPVLGSRSSDVLSGIGPDPLAAGTVLPVGPAPATAVVLGEPARVHAADAVSVAVVLGPRAEWVTSDSLDRFLTRAWTVTDRSNRIGIRLDGEPLRRAVEEELPSEPTVAGAVQVPADGRPVVFLADHPVTGGYPVVAVVVDAGLDTLAQVRPGERVRFRVDRLEVGHRP